MNQSIPKNVLTLNFSDFTFKTRYFWLFLFLTCRDVYVCHIFQSYVIFDTWFLGIGRVLHYIDFIEQTFSNQKWNVNTKFNFVITNLVPFLRLKTFHKMWLNKFGIWFNLYTLCSIITSAWLLQKSMLAWVFDILSFITVI